MSSVSRLSCRFSTSFIFFSMIFTSSCVTMPRVQSRRRSTAKSNTLIRRSLQYRTALLSFVNNWPLRTLDNAMASHSPTFRVLGSSLANFCSCLESLRICSCSSSLSKDSKTFLRCLWPCAIPAYNSCLTDGGV